MFWAVFLSLKQEMVETESKIPISSFPVRILVMFCFLGLLENVLYSESIRLCMPFCLVVLISYIFTPFNIIHF